VKKGEKSVPIIFFKSSIRSAKDIDIDNKNEVVSDNRQHCLGHKVVSRELKPSYFLRNYQVYGIEQSTLPKESYQTQPSDYKESVDHERILKVIHEYCDREKIQVEYAGLRAFYHTKKDCIQIPRRENFDTIEAFYGTLAHELAHSTGHRDRL
jgi:antirestriction protein ArdC